MIIRSVSCWWNWIMIWFTILRSGVETRTIIFMCISLCTRLCWRVVIVAWTWFFVIVGVIFGRFFWVDEQRMVMKVDRLEELIVLILRLPDEFESEGTISLFGLASSIGFLWRPKHTVYLLQFLTFSSPLPHFIEEASLPIDIQPMTNSRPQAALPLHRPLSCYVYSFYCRTDGSREWFAESCLGEWYHHGGYKCRSPGNCQSHARKISHLLSNRRFCSLARFQYPFLSISGRSTLDSSFKNENYYYELYSKTIVKLI